LKVLVIGGGGREHALVWKISRSPRVTEIFCAPGNAGIAGLAKCVDISGEDIDGLLAFALQEKIDLTVVGPEAPLTMGVADAFEKAGIRVFGPSARAAAIEGSKVLAKDIMAKYGIPTAGYAAFDNASAAEDYIRRLGAPCVVKADGLAAGKGVIVAATVEEAVDAVRLIMSRRVFGSAGDKVIIEECLVGEEVSILAFTDGETVLPMLPAQDHKRIYEGDSGPNTGGMGAYAPAPVCTPELYAYALEKILVPMVRGMALEGRNYRGVLYAGLMVTGEGPKVLEYNVRFGDPEAQPVLMLLESDLVDIMEAIIDKRLADMEIKWKKGAAVCVVLASGGYPGCYRKGDVISGLGQETQGIMVFHAGTALRDGNVVTSGGRVLGVTALGDDIPSAIAKVYNGVENIGFEGMQYRKDIGQKALERF
jgi:phosphoribosylamine--glycine ligase